MFFLLLFCCIPAAQRLRRKAAPSLVESLAQSRPCVCISKLSFPSTNTASLLLLLLLLFIIIVIVPWLGPFNTPLHCLPRHSDYCSRQPPSQRSISIVLLSVLLCVVGESWDNPLPGQWPCVLFIAAAATSAAAAPATESLVSSTDGFSYCTY